MPGPNEYAVWGSQEHQDAHAQRCPTQAADVPAERSFAASNDRCTQMLRVNGVVVESFAPSLTSLSLIEQEAGQTASALPTEKARRLADPGFYATATVGGRTEAELSPILDKVLELPNAGADLVYASFEELSSSDGEIASALAVLEPLFSAFEREAEDSLGHTGIVSDARVPTLYT